MSYVSYLADIHLFETARKACYDFSARFGFNSRKTFGQELEKLKAQEQAYLKSKGDNILLDEVTLSSEQITQTLNECKEVCANLKDD